MEVVDIQEHACKHPRVENGEADVSVAGLNGELYRWRNSSRIIRVSRASGGKDRHSKVWTSKGLRDRRVRLSVPTAIQFYDLQDRLGYDQPSKAIEWLIKAAADAISDLPSLEASFAATPTQFSGEKRVSTGMEVDAEVIIRQKSTCSSPSDTSKGSRALSLCQSKTRIKARDRGEKEENHKVNHLSVSPSFTELLTSSVGRFAGNSAPFNSEGEQSFFPPSSTMDYFVSPAIQPSGFPGQMCCLSPTMATPSFSCSNENQGGMQRFSDHHIPNGSDYNLNFTISSGVTAGLSRGTLQSNSPSVLARLQRFTSSIDGPNLPFYVGATTTHPAAAHPGQIHHQLSDGQLQLWNENHSQNGKGKK